MKSQIQHGLLPPSSTALLQLTLQLTAQFTPITTTLSFCDFTLWSKKMEKNKIRKMILKS
jgi:hypothetical protein